MNHNGNPIQYTGFKYEPTESFQDIRTGYLEYFKKFVRGVGYSDNNLPNFKIIKNGKLTTINDYNQTLEEAGITGGQKLFLRVF
jgi:hypothetical protein